MKFLVKFEEDIKTRRTVEAIVEADCESDIRDIILDRDYEVEDCYDCYDTDWDLIRINSVKPYEDMEG